MQSFLQQHLLSLVEGLCIVLKVKCNIYALFKVCYLLSVSVCLSVLDLCNPLTDFDETLHAKSISY